MHRRLTALLGIVAAVIAAPSQRLAAQPCAVFQHIVGKPEVRLHLESGETIAGRFSMLAGDTVKVETSAGVISTKCQNSDTIWVDGNKWRPGAIAGAITAGALVGWIGVELCADSELSCASAVGSALVGATVGVVMGGLIGGAFPQWQRRYPP